VSSVKLFIMTKEKMYSILTNLVESVGEQSKLDAYRPRWLHVSFTYGRI
jgi:hypothetical protein